MASKFNLTAQLSLAAPTNVAQIVRQVNQQLQGIQMNINPNVNAKSLNQANQAVQNVGVSAKVTSKNLNSAAGSAGSLGTALGAAARRFASITIATGFFLALTRAIGSAVGRAIAFEKEMLKISQVTGKSVRSLRDLSSEVTRLSGTLGVSSEELLTAARTLSQAGFAAEKVTGALRILAQTDLAATFDNIKDTTEGAIAILSQFRKEVKAAGGEVQFLGMAMDSINAVSKNFAVESADLISVVRRTGGVFEAAGGKLNELIALFTSVRATTRETADTIATGFRTIFTRIQRTETIDSLRELGIVLQDTEGKFVGPMEAIARLSAGLKSLDPRDFRFTEIVEQLGGFRQIGKVIPLIKQYQTSTAALAVANNSLGSTAKDAAIAQQGLGNQFAQLKEKFDATIRSLADSETFQTLATSAIKMAEAILRIVDALEPLLPMLTALAAFKMGQIAIPAFGKFAGMGGMNAGGKIHAFASGGMVPGRGNRDTVPAVLTPGEFVMRKSAVKKIGAGNMADMNNGYAAGGTVTARRSNYGQNASPTAPPSGMTVVPAAQQMQGAPSMMIPGGGGPPLPLQYSYGVVVLKDSVGLADETRVDIKSGQKYGDNDLSTKIRAAAKQHYPDIDSAMAETKVKKVLDYHISGRSQQLAVAGVSSTTTYRAFQDGIEEGIMKGLNHASKKVASETGATHTEVTAESAIAKGFWGSINSASKGNMFEAVIDNLTTAEPYSDAPSVAGQPFDFVGGLTGSIASAFTSVVADKTMVDAKASMAKSLASPMATKIANILALNNIDGMAAQFEEFDESKFDADQLLQQENMAAQPASGLTLTEQLAAQGMTPGAFYGGKIGHYAEGGKTDTVPAMLTPGEFVMKKSAAQGIGYSNLHRMNQSNGVNGYAAGGIVTGTRGNYGQEMSSSTSSAGGLPPGGGGTGDAMAKVAKAAGELVTQLTNAGVAISGVVDDFKNLESVDDKILQPINQFAQALASTIDDMVIIQTIDDKLIAAIVPFQTAMATAGTAVVTSAEGFAGGLTTVDDVLRVKLEAAIKVVETGMVNFSKGLTTIDDTLKAQFAVAMKPIEAAMKGVQTHMDAFGKELIEKAKLFDQLNDDIVAMQTAMTGYSENLALRTEQIVVLQGAFSEVSSASASFSKGLILSIQAIGNAAVSFRAGVSTAIQGMSGGAMMGGASSAMGKITQPASEVARLMLQLAHTIAAVGETFIRVYKAAFALEEALQKAGQSIVHTATGSADTAQFFAELEQAIVRAITSINSAAKGAATAGAGMATGAGAGAAGGGMMMAGAAKGGGGAGGGQMMNNLMMAGMAAGMLAQSMDGLSEGQKTFITDLTMMGMMLGMVAMSMTPLLTGFLMLSKGSIVAAATKAQEVAVNSAANAVKAKAIAVEAAKNGVTAMSIVAEKASASAAVLADLDKAAAAKAAATADRTKSKAAMFAGGVMIGLALALTIVMMASKKLAKQAKELTEEYQDSVKELQGGGGDMNVADAQAKVRSALQKEAAASASMWGGITSALVVAAAAIALFAAGIVTGGVAWAIAAAVAIAAAGAAGSELAASWATAEEAIAGASDLMVGATIAAAKALGEHSNATKAMEIEQLEGVALLSRQNQAFTGLAAGATAASAGFAAFRGAMAGTSPEFKGEMMDSDTFQAVKDTGVDAMKAMADALYTEAAKLQTNMGSAIDEMVKGGMSAGAAFASANIQQGLKNYEIAIMEATRLSMMQSGQMTGEAKLRLGLQGVLEENMSTEQKAAIQVKENQLIQKASTEQAKKAREAQEKAMKSKIDADKKAEKAAAQKLAADKAMAVQAYAAQVALAEFSVGLIQLKMTTQTVMMEFDALTGTIKQFKSNTADLIKSLGSGVITPEAEQAVTGLGATLGIEREVKGIVDSMKENERIRKVLTKKGLKEFTGTLSESAANLRFDDFLKRNNIDLSGLDADVRGEIMDMLKDGLDPSEITKIMGYLADANKEQLKALGDLAKAQDAYLNSLSRFADGIIKAQKSYRDSLVFLAEVQVSAAERMAKATGRDLTVREVGNNERQVRNAGLGLNMRAGGANVVGGQIKQKRNRSSQISDEISGLAGIAGSGEQIVRLQNEQKQLADETKQLTANLKSLADQSKLAAAIMGEIDKEKSKRESIQGLISEFTFASNKGRQDMDRNFMALQRVMQTGNLNSIPDEMRAAVGGLLDSLKDIAIGPQGQTGGEIKKALEMQMANQLKIRATGKPLTAEEMNKIFNQTTKEEQLINDLRALGAEEVAAANQLASQEAGKMDQLIQRIGELITTLKNARNDAAQNLAAGGVVYASEGQGIFKPKGTDTVPAMLTPGEFVVNKSAAKKNSGALQSINSGKTTYLAGGGPVGLAAYTASGFGDEITYKSVDDARPGAGLNIGDWMKTSLENYQGTSKNGYPSKEIIKQAKANGVDSSALGGLPGSIPLTGPAGGDSSLAFLRGGQGGNLAFNFPRPDTIKAIAPFAWLAKQGLPSGTVGRAPTMGDVAVPGGYSSRIPSQNEGFSYFWAGGAQGAGPAGWKSRTSEPVTRMTGYGARLVEQTNNEDVTGNSDDLAEFIDETKAGRADLPAFRTWSTRADAARTDVDAFTKFPILSTLGHTWLGEAYGWRELKQLAANGTLNPVITSFNGDNLMNLAGGSYDPPVNPNASYFDGSNINTHLWPKARLEAHDMFSGPNDVQYGEINNGFDSGKLMKGYNDNRENLATAVSSRYSYWLSKKMPEIQEGIDSYLKGETHWDENFGGAFNNTGALPGGGVIQVQGVGPGFKPDFMKLSPQAWWAEEGPKIQDYRTALLPASGPEAIDRDVIHQESLNNGGWTSIGSNDARIHQSGKPETYSMYHKNHFGESQAQYATIQTGFEDMSANLGIVGVRDGPDKERDSFAMYLTQLQNLTGIKGNFQGQLEAVREQQAADEAAGVEANAQEVKGFVEENKRLNENMDFGIFNNRAGFMQEANAKMMDDKIFRRTPFYAFRNGVPTSATRLHKIPPTAENFDALFPYSMKLARDLQTMTKGNLLAGVGPDGVNYNIAGILQSLGEVVADGAGNPTFEGAKGDLGNNLNNIIKTVKNGKWEKLKFLNNREFFGNPPNGLLGTYAMTPYQSWYDGVDGYKGLSQEEIDTSNFYFKDSIAAGGMPNQLSGASMDLWKAITDKWTVGVRALQGAGPQAQNAVGAGNFATGGPVGIDWSPRGTDTVPAMLTPGEFVMKKSAVDKYGMGFMSAINEGRGSSGGYMATGGVASGSVSQFGPQEDLRIDRVLSNTESTSKAVNKIGKDLTGTAKQTDLEGGFSAMKWIPDAIRNLIDASDAYIVSQLQTILNTIDDTQGGLAMDQQSIIDSVHTATGPVHQQLSDDHQMLKNMHWWNNGVSRENFGRLAGAIPAMVRPFNPAGPPQFMATGGMARGTDTVPAMLTPGEFVMKKSVVDKYGVGFMRSLNNGASPTSRSRGVQYLGDGDLAKPGGGGLFAGVGDIVSSISDSLSAFTQAFSLFSGLSSMLSNTINSIADLNITHTINLQGSINIPGFSQESINDIINTVANEAVKNADKQIRKALRQRDVDNENKT